MTFEKKCLIELDDIQAIQYACSHCGAATSVPIDRLSAEQAQYTAANKCACCGKDSGFQHGTPETTAFVSFISALKQIVGPIKGRNLKLRLDIKCQE